jgi:hypothetical protein
VSLAIAACGGVETSGTSSTSTGHGGGATSSSSSSSSTGSSSSSSSSSSSGGATCATDADCAALAADPCKVDVACDAATAICVYSLLDKDGDGQAPLACGGFDCDDNNPARHPGAVELCDGIDNDCNGTVDDNAVCPGGGACQNGSCLCDPANTCNGVCVDLEADPLHCGACTNPCIPGADCVNAQCVCPTGETQCNGKCVDLKTDASNCNGCGNVCPPSSTCQNGACSCPNAVCNGLCVDLQTDPAHCGTCTNACGAGTTCQGGSCQGCLAPDLFLLVDLSSSMAGSLVTGTTRLAAVKNGITAFTAEAGLTLGLGLGFFPSAANTCSFSSYTSPAVSIAPLPGNAAAIDASITAAAVGSSSPEHPALQGALSQAAAYAQSHAGHKAAVVLIADGLPDSCTTPNVAADLAAVAATYLAAKPSVKTYVVAIGADVPAATWNTIAAAGGTGAAIQVVDTAAYKDVLNALDGVRTMFGACSGGGACAHDECVVAAALDPLCSSCVAAVCLQDSFCCSTSWDALCVGEVPKFCASKTCP